MSVEFLFEAVFILTFIFNEAANGHEQLIFSSNNQTTSEHTEEWNFSSTSPNIFEEKIDYLSDNVSQSELRKNMWNQTQTPLFLNLIINLNFMSDNENKIKKHKKLHGRFKRDLLTTTDKMVEEQRFKRSTSENLGNIFEKIKLRMELQRKKRNIEFQNNGEDKLGLQNGTNEKKNKIQDILNDRFPKMSLLNDDKELDVTKWLKNWKDILAVNPVLGTEKPTKPEVKFIEEWKYSYRVTLYNSETYNVSNFLCSGILVSSQWVLTSVFCNLGDDITIIIGVHTLPRNVSEHNRYGVLKKVYSLNEKLELIQMDRPVQWIFKAPEIRAVKMEEMENLLRRRKCNLLSWMPVDIDRDIFELRQYPQLTLRSDMRRDRKKNSIKVNPVQPYHSSKKDIGTPVLCDDAITGILLDVDDYEEMTVELLCPVLEWITFFTREGSYFEVTARKFTLRNSASGTKPYFFLVAFIGLLVV